MKPRVSFITLGVDDLEPSSRSARNAQRPKFERIADLKVENWTLPGRRRR